MEKKVREPAETAILFGNDSVYRLLPIKETFPGSFADALRKRCRALATVELVICIPERPPSRVVGSLNGSYK